MKKWIWILVVCVVVIGGVFFVRPGFETRTDVHLQEFAVSEGGSAITVKTFVSGSMGYIRAMKTEQTGDELHCSFYRTFGGLNSSIGAKNTFEIKVDGSVNKIYFDRGTEPDMLMLERDIETGVWDESLPPL